MKKQTIDTVLLEAARKAKSILWLSKQSGVPYAACHRFVRDGGGITLATAAKFAEVLGFELRLKGR